MFKYVHFAKSALVRRLYANSTDSVDIAKQIQLFEKLGLDRELGLERINKLCKAKFDKAYSEQNGMWSEHLVLMAAISLSNRDVKSILEIGTFEGETTLILNELFPGSSIETIDLARQEILDQGIYNYAAESIVDSQEKMKSDNINFRVMNSVGLINYIDKYDLIWVDGTHTSPVSIIDITNSIRLLSQNGIAICDDVYLEPNAMDLVSDVSSIETLRTFQDSGHISYELIRKRVSKRFNNFLVKPKFLGIYWVR